MIKNLISQGNLRETNAKSIKPFKTLRLLCSAGLLVLSCYEVVPNDSRTTAVLVPLLCSHVSLIFYLPDFLHASFQLYITILSLTSLTTRIQRWRTLSTRHVACLSMIAFFCYAWIFLKPYIIVDHFNSTVSNDRTLGWVKFGLLATSGVFIPFFMPRSFIALVSDAISIAPSSC